GIRDFHVTGVQTCALPIYFNDGTHIVSPQEMQRYMGKISGPLLDRIDIHIEVTPVPFDKLSENEKPEPSSEIRKRVIKARDLQTDRKSTRLNSSHVKSRMP